MKTTTQTKPLYERLREWANEDMSTCSSHAIDSLREILGVETDVFVNEYPDDMRNCIRAIADEIEREQRRIIEAQDDHHDGTGPSAHNIMATYTEKHGKPMDGMSITEWLNKWYMPLPVDKKGEPWMIGDACVIYSSIDETDGEITGYVIRENETRLLISTENGETDLPATFIKRPTKIYDADGVEIRVGDTVYHEENGAALVVTEITDMTQDVGAGEETLIKVNSDEWVEVCSGSVTHKRPVLDADGIVIKEGDTVYIVLDNGEEPYGMRYTVARLEPDSELPVVLESSEGCGNLHFRFDGKSLTHREPDSLEKLRDDMNGITHPTEAAYGEFISRLSALIERGQQ